MFHARRQPTSFPSTPQRRDGSTETCPTLSKRSSRRCPRMMVQNKEMSTALRSTACPWEWWQPKHAGVFAAQQAAGNLPWIGGRRPFRNAALTSRTHSQDAESFQFSAGADDPRHTLQENGGPADLWYIGDGDIFCHPILVPSYLLNLMTPTSKFEQSEPLRKQKSSTTSQTCLFFSFLFSFFSF